MTETDDDDTDLRPHPPLQHGQEVKPHTPTEQYGSETDLQPHPQSLEEDLDDTAQPSEVEGLHSQQDNEDVSGRGLGREPPALLRC